MRFCGKTAERGPSDVPPPASINTSFAPVLTRYALTEVGSLWGLSMNCAGQEFLDFRLRNVLQQGRVELDDSVAKGRDLELPEHHSVVARDLRLLHRPSAAE